MTVGDISFKGFPNLSKLKYAKRDIFLRSWYCTVFFQPSVETKSSDDLRLKIPSRKAFVDDKLEKMLADLQRQTWFHGSLPFEDIVVLLKNDGDFVIRELEPEDDRMAMACVTVRWQRALDYPVHYFSQGNDRVYTINGKDENSDVMELVRFHHRTGTPVSDGVKLQHPIEKQHWELNSDKVTFVKKIGAGAFGEVWQGMLTTSVRNPSAIVAIKVTKVNEENKAKIDEMYKEARLMRQYKHKNVVAFHGIAKRYDDSVMIVMEMVEGGGLDHYLRKNRTISNREKIGYAADVAVGLVYLHSKGCIHRDVACRNCLIDVKKNVVKISGFGLSKQAEFYMIPHGEKLPIRWQAPEVFMTRIHTKKSDVYSYGIFIWEIFNSAHKPFRGIDTKTVKIKICNPKFRPQVDPKIPIIVQRAMKACWRANPKKRPEMNQAARYLMSDSSKSQDSEQQQTPKIRWEREKTISFRRSRSSKRKRT